MITTLCLGALKCFTSVYIHKKIGDKRGRRGVENSPGRLTHWGGGADVKMDETQSAFHALI